MVLLCRLPLTTLRFYQPRFLSTNATVLNEILEEKTEFGFHGKVFKDLPKKRIIVEFSSPNIAKKFHAGHFRSTIIGNCLSNIFERAGHDVIRMNYLGDWGIQFALLYVGFKKFGNDEDLRNSSLKHLLDVYVKVNEEAINDEEITKQAQDVFHKMEFTDHKDSLNFWNYCRDLSLKEFKKLYEKLNVKFDEYLFESSYVQKSHNLLSKLIDDLRLGVITDGDGRRVVDLSETSWYHGLKLKKKSAVLARSNGTALYLTRDIASILERKQEYNFDEIYYVVDTAQTEHFLQFFGTLEKMEVDDSSRSDGCLHHVSFGRVKGMKTRMGEVVFLDDILKEAIEKVREERTKHETTKEIEDEEHVIRNIALTGLICNDLKSRRVKDYKFNWELVLARKGYTGTYLQYTHSRLCNLEKNCGLEISSNVEVEIIEAGDLVKHLNKYGMICEKAYTTLEPYHVSKYLFELCHLVSKHLTNLRIKNEPDKKLATSRLLIFHCSRVVLNNGMRLLGAIPLDKM